MELAQRIGSLEESRSGSRVARARGRSPTRMPTSLRTMAGVMLVGAQGAGSGNCREVMVVRRWLQQRGVLGDAL